MAFMEPDIQHTHYYEVSADHGSTWIVPADVVGTPRTWADFSDYVEGTIDNPDDDVTPDDRRYGWIARLSAPGYLDCTDWSAHASEAEAREHLREMYGDEDGEPEDEADKGEL